VEVQGILNFKFLGPVSFTILIVGLLGSAGQAQASVPPIVFWDGGGEGNNWSDRFNWSDDQLPSEFDCQDIFIDLTDTDVTVLFDLDIFIVCGTLNIGEGDTLIIDSNAFLADITNDFTINNDGTLIINGFLFTAGTFNNNGVVINNLILLNTGTFNNNGILTNNLILQNSGPCTMNNFGLITNNLLLFSFNTCTINNFGSIENFDIFFIDTLVTLNNFCGSSFLNESDELLNAGTINGVNLISGEPVEDFGGTTTRVSCGGGGGDNHESPTIGQNSAGIQIVKSKGICIDAQCWTVAEFDTGFKLLPLLSSRHTITNTIFCNEGVQECDFVGVAFMTSTDQFGELVMMVEAQKTGGEWTISWYDPQDFIHDPDDYPVGDPRGAITFTVQIVDDTGILSENGNFLLTSFTIDFKNKDTGELVIRIQAGDEELGQSTFWFNEGVEFIDSDAYPSIVTEFEESLEIDSLCLNEDSTYRYSCAFAEIRDLATQNAEETLRQIMNNEYTYK